ncbi:hypothetical protein JCM5353_007101 [Sporobolomyces roseus]
MASDITCGNYEPTPSNFGASSSALTLDSPPTRIASANAPNASQRDSGAFFRDARICPDGSRVLTAADDRSLSLYPLPSQTLTSPQLAPHWIHSPSDSLLSFDWYPGASSADPSMFAFAMGVKDHPVHLLDGNDRRIRASYPIIDHTERFIAPNSMLFALDGTSLYCGFENAIEIFDVSRPGEEGFRMKTTASRTSRTGQKGLISTLDFSPSQGTSLLAAGSFAGSIGLYNSSSPSPLVGILPSTQKGGITKVLFHPTMDHLLFAASRQSNYIEVFDLRNFALEPIKLERKGRTNQRLGFDIDPTGEWLIAGDQASFRLPLLVGNTSRDNAHTSHASTRTDLSLYSTPLSFLTPILQLPSNQHILTRFLRVFIEPIGATFFHPDFPNTNQIVTCSGTRKFPLQRKGRRGKDGEDDESSEDESDSDGEGETLAGEVEEDGKDSLQVFTLG